MLGAMSSRFLATGAILAMAAVVATLWTAVGGAAETKATAACRITQKKSLKGVSPTSVTFVNKTPGAVQLYWLDYKGHLIYYRTLSPGATAAQPTFTTHPWLALDRSFKCVGYVVAPKATYTITS
jgi:ABC-type amino acid transport system permease subunit